MSKKTLIIVLAIVVFVIGFLWLKRAAPPTEPNGVMESPLNNDLPDPSTPAPESGHN